MKPSASMAKKLLLAAVTVLPLLSLTQCGYQLGGIKPPQLTHVETFKVNLFKNFSLEPRANVLVTSALSEALQRDGTFKINSEKSADIRIEGEIRSITFSQLRSSRQDTYESTELGLNLTVRYEVLDNKDNKTLLEGTVSEIVPFYNLNNNVQTARTNALSYAARRIADRIAENLTNG